jgi:hypothetical protein
VLEVGTAVEEEMRSMQQEEVEFHRDSLWLHRPDEREGCSMEFESRSDGDDDPDRAPPVGLGRVLEQLLDAASACDAVDMEQVLWDVQVAAKRLVDLGDVGKYVTENFPGASHISGPIKYVFNPHAQK